jgi:galactan endo-1,6-beta-galactosidase
LRSELNKVGLTDVMVSASDENTYDLARSTWNAMSLAAKSVIGRVNVHGYAYTTQRRDLLAAAVASSGKHIWNSEYGDGDASGQKLADSLLLDFTWLHPYAWVYWQPLDRNGWGAINADINKTTIKSINTKYFVMAQFMRHIRPGMQIIPSAGDDWRTVAAYDVDNRKLVVVAQNNSSTGQWINFDLSAFSRVQGDTKSGGALVRRWATQTGGGYKITKSGTDTGAGERYAYHADTFLYGSKQFRSWFPPYTIQTFEIDNVSL